MLFLGLIAVTLNVSIFIARKIQKAHNSKGSIIGPVIKAATLAIILGMILMIVSLATGFGLKQAIRDKIVGFSGHVTISNYDINNSFESAPILLDSSLKEEILALPDVKHLQAVGTKAGILKGSEDFEGVVLKGVDENYDNQFFVQNIIEGVWPKISAEKRNDSILISSVLANRLKLKLHEPVTMYFIQEAPRPPRIRKFYIAGIYATGLEEYDKNFLIGDLHHIKRLNNWENGEVGGYEVLLNSADNIDEGSEKIRATLPYNLDAKSIKTTNAQLFQWLDLFDLNIYLILFIMVAVAIINMISALLILILDRTNMIGLLKAMGANNGQVARIFLYQSFTIIIKGMFWGNLIGIGLCVVQQHFGLLHLDPETYYVSTAPVALDFMQILFLNLGVLVICLISLILPAFIVSRTSPVRALRYE